MTSMGNERNSIVTAAAFQSVGRAKEALLLTLGGIILVKLPVLLLASSLFSLNGIWVSEAISELILCAVSWSMLKNFHDKTYVRLQYGQARLGDWKK